MTEDEVIELQRQVEYYDEAEGGISKVLLEKAVARLVQLVEEHQL
jgi:hypothetical protein